MVMTARAILAAILAVAGGCRAFAPSSIGAPSRIITPTLRPATRSSAAAGNKHGEGSCFLPLLQNDEQYVAPRIVQIAGSYPGVDVATYLAVESEPSPEMGQWNYDFPDPSGPQMGSVALPGMASVYETEDPVVVISDHQTLGVQLPPALTEPVELVVLCDRARTGFAERKFLVLGPAGGGGDATIAAFESRGDVPDDMRILGQVTLVQIPWLPSMQKKTSGFMEEDQLF